MRKLAIGGPDLPQICAHACAVDGGPPHTLSGVRALLAAGAEMIEIDVRRAGDGALLAHHDDRLPDRRHVSAVTAAEAMDCYPDEHRPARVEELLALAADRSRILLDLKQRAIEEQALGLALNVIPEDRVVITSLDAHQVARVKRMRPRVRAGLSVNRSSTGYVHAVGRARTAGADLLAVNHVYLRSPLARRALSANLRLFVWTVDTDRLLTRVLADSRVACVITNRPLRAHALRTAALS